MITSNIENLAAKVISAAQKKRLRIAIAESCTGGLLCAALTSIPGSSEVFDRGFVAYSVDSKIESLGINPEIIEKHGAISTEVALAMAKQSALLSRCHIGIGITGIAGPTGETRDAPIGLIIISVVHANINKTAKYHFVGSRNRIRMEATSETLKILINLINEIEI